MSIILGGYRVKGSHHIFKVPWSGQPWVNIQKDGKHAKPYQVKQVLAAIEKRFVRILRYNKSVKQKIKLLQKLSQYTLMRFLLRIIFI